MTTNFIHEYVGSTLAPHSVLGNSDGVAKVRVKFPDGDDTVDIRFELADDTAVNFRVDMTGLGVPPALRDVTLLDNALVQVTQPDGLTNSSGPNRFSIYAAAGNPALPDNSVAGPGYTSAQPVYVNAGNAYVFRVRRNPSNHPQAVDYVDFTLTVNASGEVDATPEPAPFEVYDPNTGRRGFVAWEDGPAPIHGHGSGGQ